MHYTYDREECDNIPCKYVGKEVAGMKILAVRAQRTDRLKDGVFVTSWGWTIEIDGQLATDVDGDVIYFSMDRADVVHEIARLIRLAWNNYHTDIEEAE